ncbi:hypothetical protein BDQ17DRAFT_1422750 [Cyathus striatus]|nr:hypothetical protein BDQ17DRAFT_1422750 [Cyathus striatus]
MPTTTVESHSDSITIADSQDISEAENNDDMDNDSIISFSALADELMADVTEADLKGTNHDSPNNSDSHIDYHTLKHLFHYASQSNLCLPSYKFMLEYWKKAELGINMEVTFHEAEAEQVATCSYYSLIGSST